jgi:hypothetical protein
VEDAPRAPGVASWEYDSSSSVALSSPSGLGYDSSTSLAVLEIPRSAGVSRMCVVSTGCSECREEPVLVSMCLPDTPALSGPRVEPWALKGLCN